MTYWLKEQAYWRETLPEAASRTNTGKKKKSQKGILMLASQTQENSLSNSLPSIMK